MKLTPAEIRAVIALAVGMFCVQVDFFALNLALPRMAVDLNETTSNMQWVISAYMIAVGAAMIPGGRLGDLRGHRRIVVAGLVVFGGASLVCGLSFSYGLLIGFRALQGLGAAALFTVSVAAISNAVARDHRAVAIGLLFGIANIGTGARPVHRRTFDRAAQLALGVLPQRPAQCDRHLLLSSMGALDGTRGGDGADRLARIDPRQLRHRRSGLRG
jgi:MFS family permease